MNALTRLRAGHIEHFRTLLGGSGVLSRAAGDDISPFLTDWTGKFRATTNDDTADNFVVLRPTSTEQVSQILAFCHRERIGVVPQGGNTGLVGGGTPYPSSSPFHAGVVLSLGRMNRILEIDRMGRTVRAEAGCVLETLDAACRVEAGLTMPIDLGAKGSCQLGGMLATNAGGIRFLRYGSLHGSTLGMEAVLADGRVFADMRGLHKDNTGYDVKQLLIGSEGTLGVITAATIRAAQLPTAVNVACFRVSSFSRVLELFFAARGALAEILTAVEFWDGTCHAALNAHHARDPFPDAPPSDDALYVLIETGGSDGGHDAEKLGRFLEDVLAREIVADGVLAQDETQQTELWKRREGIPEACARQPLTQTTASGKHGQVHKYDLSLPHDKYFALVPLLRARVPAGIHVFGFGHVGDGNIHVNVVDCLRTSDSAHVIDDLSAFIFEWVAANGGSVSAEHGIGQAKREHLAKSKDAISISLMHSLKQLFDPRGILNPGKVL